MTDIKTYSFKEQLALANVYEEKILAYYNTLKGSVNVTDLRKNPKFQKYDIDFLRLYLHEDIVKAKTIEIKIDFMLSRTGNFFIELSGWYEKCKAEIILYVDAYRKLGYHLNNKELHEFINAKKHLYQTREVVTGDFGGYKVTGLLVPYKDILDATYPYVENLTNII